MILILHKKRISLLRISSVNVTKSKFTEEILSGKLHSLCSVTSYFSTLYDFPRLRKGSLWCSGIKQRQESISGIEKVHADPIMQEKT